MTGEHFQVYRLRNRGRHSCRLFGYPGVSLYDGRGAAMPFAYQRGAGPYVTHARPRTVVIAPGYTAFFMMAKYRCDLRADVYATTVRVFPPAGNLSLRASTGRGVSSFVYCAARDDMLGRIVYVSPVEPTYDATSIFADLPRR